MNDLSFLSISELAAAFEARDLSPVTVTRAMLDRIGEGNSGAFLSFMG